MNIASGPSASVLGGVGNNASGRESAISGGFYNTADGEYSSVTGGRMNKADSAATSVSGGYFNTASFLNSSVSGGAFNTASGWASNVSGGASNTASGSTSSVLGGGFNVASEMKSTIIGQKENSFVGDSLNGQEGETDAYYLVSSGMANLSDYLTVDTTSHTLTIAGANLAIVNGGDSTNAEVNGLGNIIIGYNEDENYDSTPYNGTPDPDADEKTGSHNLIVGAGHTYTSFGGIVAGYDNNIEAECASITGGLRNTVSGIYSSVTGGDYNTAQGLSNTIVGGFSNTTQSFGNTIVGGGANVIDSTAIFSSILGGWANKITYAIHNTTAGGDSTINKGVYNVVAGNLDRVHLADSDSSLHGVNTTPCIDVVVLTTSDQGSGGSIDLIITTENDRLYSVLWSGPDGFTSTAEDITGIGGDYTATVTLDPDEYNMLPVCSVTVNATIDTEISFDN